MTDERLSGALQENLLTLLCFDNANCKIARAALTPQLFESSVFREVAGVAISFIDQYGEAVGEHLPDHLEDILKGDDARKASSYKRLVDDLFLSKDGLNSAYVLSQLQTFVRAQSFKSAMVQAVEAMEDGNIEAAEVAMQKGLAKQVISFDKGLNLKDPETWRQLLAGDLNEEGFDLGISELDRLGIIPRRKELFMLIAPRGRGKSWFITHCAKMALLQRWCVVVITLEMSDKRYAARMIQTFFSVSDRESKVRLATLVKNRDGSLDDVLHEEVERLTLSRKEDRDKLSERIVRDFKRRKPLVIKQFPTSAASMVDVEAYLDQLERFENIVPDLICLDYPDLIKHDVKNKRLELGRILEDFRGLLVRRNAAGVAVSQGNRDSEDATTVTGGMVAEDISKLATVDVCITLSRTPMEERLGLARILVEKARNQRDGFSVLITQAYAIGQFCLDSVVLKAGDYWEMMKEKKQDADGRRRHKTDEDDDEEPEKEERRDRRGSSRRAIRK